MKKFSTVEEMKSHFISKGWTEGISFRVVLAAEAKGHGWAFMIPEIQNGRKYFILNDTGDVYDDSGKIVMYNLTTIGDEPKMDVDEAMAILHASSVGFSYDTDPARYTIKQADLPKLFEYVKNRQKIDR